MGVSIINCRLILSLSVINYRLTLEWDAGWANQLVQQRAGLQEKGL